MKFKSKVFNSVCLALGNGNYLHLINIEGIDSNLESYIDKSIVKICEGNALTNLSLIKKRLIDFLKTKKGSNIEMGSIAEFFTHLYLREMGYNQEFLFLNLEEGSIKKGFDGYYSFLGDEWIYESKSGSISTANISHDGKIKEAYNDLTKKISGDIKNNPWQNAYNHASHIDVGSVESIRKNIKKFSEDFIHDKFHNIKDFNIIPGSTIFLDGGWEKIDPADLKIKIKALVKEFNFKKITIICVNKRSIELFWDYLKK